MVGAHSFVNRDVADREVVAGVPAREIGGRRSEVRSRRSEIGNGRSESGGRWMNRERRKALGSVFFDVAKYLLTTTAVGSFVVKDVNM